MNRHYFVSLILAVFMLLFYSCKDHRHNTNRISTSEKEQVRNEHSISGPQKKIVVYGSLHCDECHDLLRKLDSRGIEYIFKDVDSSYDSFKEMNDKLLAIGYDGFVEYPVLDIEGDILIRPEYKQIETLLF